MPLSGGSIVPSTQGRVRHFNNPPIKKRPDGPGRPTSFGWFALCQNPFPPNPFFGNPENLMFRRKPPETDRDTPIGEGLHRRLFRNPTLQAQFVLDQPRSP